jgi:polygalacturonase
VKAIILVLMWAVCANAQSKVYYAVDYGLVANDGVAQNRQLSKAIMAAHESGGGIVQLPEGRIILAHIKLNKIKGVTLRGVGPATVLIRKRAQRAPDNARIMQFNHVEDFTLQDLDVDMNGIQQFGGIGAYGVRNFTMERVRIYDSKKRTYDPRYDRYAIVFGFAGLEYPHENIVLRHNRISDLQVEIDHARGVLVHDNVFERGEYTAALGSFGLGSGYVFEDVTIRNNYFIDASRQAISLQMDFGAHKNVHDVSFQRIHIHDNTFVYTPQIRHAPSLALRVGMHNNSLSTPGTQFKDIRILNNAFYIQPGVPHSKNSLIFANTSKLSKIVFSQLSIRENVLFADAPRKLVEVRRVEGDSVLIDNNVTFPYKPIPSMP